MQVLRLALHRLLHLSLNVKLRAISVIIWIIIVKIGLYFVYTFTNAMKILILVEVFDIKV